MGVRTRAIRKIFMLLLIFFNRQVLCIGLLKNIVFRVAFGCLLVLFGLFLTYMLLIFFKGIDDQKTAIYVMAAYSNTVINLALIVFFFLKILFTRTKGILKYTIQLPVTNRERNLAINLFEITIAMALMAIVTASVCASIAISAGIGIVPYLITDVVYGSVTTYLLIMTFYNIMDYLMLKLHVVQLRKIVLFLIILFVVFIVNRVTYGNIMDISNNFLENNVVYNRLSIFTLIMNKANLQMATIGFLTISLVLIILILKFQTNDQVIMNRYISVIFLKRKTHMFYMYCYSIVRDLEEIIIFVTAFFIYIFLHIENSGVAPVYAFLIISVGSIYDYIKTTNLRRLPNSGRMRIPQHYFYIVTSRLVVIFFITLPFLAVDLIVGRMSGLPLYYVGAFTGIIIGNLIGILFPPKEENPFSVIVGFFIIGLATVILIIIVSTINLELKIKLVAILIVNITMVLVSVIGMNEIERKRKNGSKAY